MERLMLRGARRFSISATLIGLALCCFTITGCQDGPLYALKVANPYFSVKEWGEDEAIGVSDHVRRDQLIALSKTIDDLPAERQATWTNELHQLFDNDPSPEMRRLAVLTIRGVQTPQALRLIEKGLDDENVKVQMEACRSLGYQSNEEAVQLLASTVGTQSNQDVKHSAMQALASHKSQVAIDALQIALNDRNPATQLIAVESLRGSTGQDYGDDPAAWIAALSGQPPKPKPGFSDRVGELF